MPGDNGERREVDVSLSSVSAAALSVQPTTVQLWLSLRPFIDMQSAA